MPKALSETQIAQYHRDGFLFPVRVMSDRDAIDFGQRVQETEAAGKLKALGGETKFYLRFPWVYELATRPGLLDIVEDIVGPDIMIYHNALWAKRGGGGHYVSWHQDNTYFGHYPCEVLSMWIALTPVTVENGCMQFLPGTHKLGQLPLAGNDINDANMLTSGQTVDFDPNSITPVPIVLRPGEASLHHSFLIHGSLPNQTTDLRMGMTLIFHRPGLQQMGDSRTSALLVRGEDRFNHFDHETPPGREDDEATIDRYRQAAAAYRNKVREMGNKTIERFD
mgnify:CR=1 FL=1